MWSMRASPSFHAMSQDHLDTCFWAWLIEYNVLCR